jgi:hypothetical protein
MKLRLWPRGWAPPWFAWSCLLLQLRTYREEFSGEPEPPRVPFGFTPGATTTQITLM